MSLKKKQNDISEFEELEVLAFRSGRLLMPDEFLAHIAALTRLENIGLLLGAGASKANGLGGKTVKEIWDSFSLSNSVEVQWLESNNFIKRDATPNLELLLDKLNIAKSDLERSKNTALSNVNEIIKQLRKQVLSAALLDRKLWSSPEEAEATISEKLKSHVQILQKICAARQPGQSSPWIFTTNYDLSVEWAAEAIGLNVNNGFSGFHNRIFSPHNFDLGYLNILAKGEARFGIYSVSLAKLHGSLTWKLTDSGGVTEEPARSVYGPLENFISGKDGCDPDTFLIFPEAAKYLRTSAFVFGELFRRFSEFLSKSQSCLIVNGYSFGDDHLNRVIRSAIHNPTLQLVLYVPEITVDSATQKPTIENNPFLSQLIQLGLPQITFVGGNARAFLDKLAEHLPDPAIFNEQSERIRKLLAEKKKSDQSEGLNKPDKANNGIVEGSGNDEIPF